jgi:hypothetical protein
MGIPFSMIYDYDCSGCDTRFERNVAVECRDVVRCDCGRPARRIFRPAQVMLPERFTKWSLKSLTQSYEESKAIEKRNDEYLSQPKEPEKASFDAILQAECVKNRVDPQKLAAYKLKEAIHV